MQPMPFTCVFTMCKPCKYRICILYLQHEVQFEELTAKKKVIRRATREADYIFKYQISVVVYTQRLNQ